MRARLVRTESSRVTRVVLTMALHARCTFDPQRYLDFLWLVVRWVGRSFALPATVLTFLHHGRRWIMHRTGRYKMLNLIFGIFPFIAAILLSLMREDSPPFQLWFSIVRHETPILS